MAKVPKFNTAETIKTVVELLVILSPLVFGIWDRLRSKKQNHL